MSDMTDLTLLRPAGAALAVLAACAGCTLDSSSSTAGTASSGGGKADGATDADLCPPTVTLNSAPGSAKRCVDAQTGRFVPSECCADVCEGAGWRTQANGTACAWLSEPGLPGASLGQFAPSMCCDLQDDLACARAEGDAGSCADPISGRAVADACCDAAPQACHPVVARALSGCIFDQIDSFSSDPESLLPNMRELFELCANEGELLAPQIDARCSFQPELPFCGLDFGEVDAQFVAPCRDELRSEFDCTFGAEFPDIDDQFHLSVLFDRTLHLAQAQAADPLTQQQILAAAFDDPGDLQEAFDAFDDGIIDVMEIFDVSTGRSYTAYEFGAGDNGFGAIFAAGTTDVVTVINDSFLEDPDDPSSRGCGAPLGAAGGRCGGELGCASGLRCEGATDHPVFGSIGRCVDPTVGQDSADQECSELRACGEGSYCAGTTVGFGMCSPGWMFDTVSNDDGVSVPDGGRAESDVFVWGAATVPVDLEVDVRLAHDVDLSQLRLTLIGPLRDEGTIIPLFDGANVALPPGTTFRRFTLRAAHPGDESINGRWTLVVEDGPGEGGGGIFDWSLRYSSRFD